MGQGLVQVVTERYNVDLLDGEEAMTEAEMMEILEDDMEKMDRRYERLLLRDTLQREDRTPLTVGVDFHLLREGRKWDADESDPGTELIHQFGSAAEICDRKRMSDIQDEYAGMVEDSSGPSKVDEAVLKFMDGELERCEIQVIQEPEEPVAVPKCGISCCGVMSA